MRLTHLISVIGILIFPWFEIYAAEADYSAKLDAQHELLRGVASTKAARPYGEVLEALKTSADVYVPKESATYTAMRHAFWAEYASKVLEIEPIEFEADDTPVFLNLLSLIRGGGLPPAELLILGDELYPCFLVSIPIFDAVMHSLFPAPDSVVPVGEAGEEVLIPGVVAASESVFKGRVWFSKVLTSQFLASRFSQHAVKSRLIQVSTFLCNTLAEASPEIKARLISMVQSCILNNADDCPDRALSGLDDFEVEVQLFYADSIEEVINVLLRLYKKQMIRDYLVSHEFAESAEEYVYLVLLLNDSLNLGAINLGLSSAACGARKTYDVAIRGIISNLSFDGFVCYVARNAYMQSFLSKRPEYAEVFEAALVSSDVEEALFSATKNIIAPIMKEMFTIKGHPYTEFEPSVLEEIGSFL